MIKFSFFYIILLLSLSFFSYFFIDKNFLYLRDIYSGYYLTHRAELAIIYAFFIALFFTSYFILLKKKNVQTPYINKLLIASIIVLSLSYPAMLSSDIFNYVFTGKVLFFYKENPFIVMPIEFLGDPLLQFTQAANKIVLYGPTWILASGIPFLLGLKSYLLTLINFKIFTALIFSASLYFFWKIKENEKSFIFFAFNPLVLLETLVSNHNDMFMIFLILLSFYLFKKDKTILGFLVYLLSVGIKYVSAVLLPVFVYLLLYKSKVKWDKVYFWSFVLMFIIFLLSSLREEIYPWYAIWFLPFAFLSKDRFFVKPLVVAFTFGLMARYIPFLLLRTYSGNTQIYKTVITFFFPTVTLLYFVFKKWQGKRLS